MRKRKEKIYEGCEGLSQMPYNSTEKDFRNDNRNFKLIENSSFNLENKQTYYQANKELSLRKGKFSQKGKYREKTSYPYNDLSHDSITKITSHQHQGAVPANRNLAHKRSYKKLSPSEGEILPPLNQRYS